MAHDHNAQATEDRGAAATVVLLENHRAFLGFLQRKVGDRALAEDILQDAFVRTAGKVAAVPDDALVPWFYATLRNAVIDHWRKQGASARGLESFARELDGASEAPPDVANEICACVSRLAAGLKAEYADALASVDVGGMAVKDYAAQHGLTQTNASVRVHRARKALRARLMQSCGTCAEHGCLDCSCGATSRRHAPL
jgi:RNA polymerase sigma factor (sigma-70 family)